MPRTIGKAGGGVRRMEAGLRKRRARMLFGVLVAALALLWLSSLSRKHPSAWGGGIVLCLALVLRVLDRRVTKSDRHLRKAIRRADQGAEGEERVEEILARLPDGHVVIHDLMGDYGNIDHVVVAPHGVFAIETKSSWGRLSSVDGKLLLNGRPLAKDAVAQTVRNAMWLKELIKQRTGLEVYVHALLVFTRGIASAPLPRMRGVWVTTASYLLWAIGKPQGQAVPVDRIVAAIAPREQRAGAPAADTQPDAANPAGRQ